MAAGRPRRARRRYGAGRATSPHRARCGCRWRDGRTASARSALTNRTTGAWAVVASCTVRSSACSMGGSPGPELRQCIGELRRVAVEPLDRLADGGDASDGDPHVETAEELHLGEGDGQGRVGHGDGQRRPFERDGNDQVPSGQRVRHDVERGARHVGLRTARRLGSRYSSASERPGRPRRRGRDAAGAPASGPACSRRRLRAPAARR